MYICVYVSMYLCIYVYMYLCIYVYMYIYIVYMYMCKYIYTYKYVYMYKEEIKLYSLVPIKVGFASKMLYIPWK